ncbi:MAG: glycosyl transferase family 2, partial [Microbacterium sp. 14-71-5]
MTQTVQGPAAPTTTTSSIPVTAPVTAVVVTAGLTRYLPTTLAALAAQVRRPLRVLVVDVGGPDGVAAALDEAFAGSPAPAPRLARTTAPGSKTFGQAVTRGLLAAAEALGESPTPWLWLLHDDSAPAPTALLELMRAVSHAPSVAVAGAKQRTWTEPERLLEVGLRTTRWGRRMSDVEAGELDQGQHDGRTDVLGVGLAGALVRRDVWDALRGTDAALGPFGDGLDLSRRARLAGHRVVVVPAAVVRHAQALYQGLRDVDAGPETDLDGDGEPDLGDPRRSFAARRRSAVHARLVAAPLPLVPVVAVAGVLAAVVRALGQLAVKQPGLAAAELTGCLAALGRPGAVLRARRVAARTRAVPRRTLWPLQAGLRDVWTQEQDRRLARLEARKVQRAPSELELGELAAMATRRRWTALALTAVLLVASLAAFGRLLGPVVGAGARLVGGSLALTSSSVGQLWQAASSGWVRDGLGQAAPADPLLTVLTVPTLLAGHLQAVVDVLMLGAVVLSGIGAWAAAGAATRSAGVRAWAGLVWAAAPALLLGVGGGHLGAVIAHAALPWVALGMARAVGVQRVDQVLSGLVTVRRGDDEDDGVVDLDEDAEPAAAASTAPTTAIPSPRPAPTPAGGVASAAGSVGGVRVAGAASSDGSSTEPVGEPVHPGDSTPEPGPVLVGTPDPTGSVAGAAGAALALAVAVAGAPVLLVPAVVLAVVAAATAPRRRGRLLLVPVPAVVLAGPLLAEVVRRGVPGLRLLLAEPGLPAQSVPSGPLLRLLGVPTDPGALVPAGLQGMVATVWPLALVGTVLVLAVLALLRGAAVARGVRVGWLVAVVGLAAATVQAQVPAVHDADGVGRAWVGASLSLALLGLLTAATLGTDRLQTRLTRSTFGWRQPLAVLGSVVVVVVAVGSLASWVWTAPGATSLRSLARPVVPAVAQQAQQGADASRVLALSATSDGVSWELLRGDGLELVDQAAAVQTGSLGGGLRSATVAAADPATTELRTLVARLTSTAPGDVAGPLGGLAVAHVVVPPLPVGTSETDPVAAARAQLVGRLDATPGLERVTENASGTLWRVRPAVGADGSPAPTVVTSWARLAKAAGDVTDPATVVTAVAATDANVDTTVPAGAPTRVLVLAERADPGWHAWIDGRP